MLNWLFGRKKKGQDKEPQKKKEPKKDSKNKKNQKQDDQQWIYDALLQYLTSPLWKIPISMFIDEHCLAFDDEEQNHFEYTDIHNKFKKMIEDQLDTLIIDIGITYEQFLEQIQIGMNIAEHKKIFEQLLVADNFLVFKKLLVKRNKELELEAMKSLQEEDKKKKSGKVDIPKVAAVAGAGGNNQKLLERAQLETYEKELEHAIAMSLAAQEERSKILRKEDEDLEKALALSKIEYDRHQSKLNEEQERQKKEQQNKDKLSEEEKKKLEKMEENRKKLEEEKKKMLAEEQQKQQQQQQPQQPSQQIISQKTEEQKKIEAQQQQQQSANQTVQKDQKQEGPKQEKILSSGPLGPLKGPQNKLQPQQQQQQQQSPEKNVGIIDSKFVESEIVIDIDKKKKIEEEEEKKAEQQKQQQYTQQQEEEQKKIDSSAQFKPLQQYSILGKEDQLNTKKQMDQKGLDELMKERMALKEKLDALKQQDFEQAKKEEEKRREEDLLERKKRLQIQRDLILKKKKDEQEKELINYKMKQQLGMLNSLPPIGQQSLALGSQSIKEPEQDVQKEKNKQLMSKIQEGLKE